MEAQDKETWDSIWKELEIAVINRRHPWHIGVLATCDEGNAPRVRTVVLRAVNSAQFELRCHTDVRSLKIHEIATNPATSWLFYSPETKVQLRLSGRSTIHRDDAVAQATWQKTRISSRRCYLSTYAPGESIPPGQHHLPDDLIAQNPDLTRSEEGWEHFSVLSTKITSLDWLQLNASGHCRKQFDCNSQGTWKARIVAP